MSWRLATAANTVHLARTKVNGGTCTFIESFPRVHEGKDRTPSKNWTDASPHLIDTPTR